MATLTVLGTGPAASAAAPAPCRGLPQISDPRGDGHHVNTDVTAAWFSEAAGRLQAVVQVDVGDWKPAHDDSASAGAALLFRVGGVVRYVRVQLFPAGTQQYDHGTWTRAGGFASQGATPGTVVPEAGGTATIDVPAATGAVPGVALVGPFALTYDGASGGDLHWVDRAPGGASPDTTETGADYVVGSCGTAGGAPGVPGTPAAPGTPTPVGGPATTAVAITARRRIVGGGTVKITGKASPGRAGVPVTVLITGARGRTTRTTTRANGAWAVRVPVTETSTVKATVEGVGSQTRTILVRSTVRIAKVVRRRGGRTVVSGRVSPRLPGRVLLLRTDAVRPTTTVRARAGRFTIALNSPKRGRYQAVFIPSGERAERSTSNTKSIR